MTGLAFAAVFLMCALQLAMMYEIDSFAQYRDTIRSLAGFSFWAFIVAAMVGIVEAVCNVRSLFWPKK